MGSTNEQRLRAKYMHQRIRYEKSGSRKGWQGTVTEYNHRDRKFKVDYDNGVEQWYDRQALTGNGFDEPYLVLVNRDEAQNAPAPAPVLHKAPGKYLVVNVQGQVMESFDSESGATTFAMEQVADSMKHIRMFVYAARTEIRTRRAKADVVSLEGDDE